MKIYIVTHKKFDKPQLTKIYSTIQVGAALNKKIEGMDYYDNSGDNISDKNLIYNEMTAAYWIWKNSKEDIVGLCHYRRYFVHINGLFGRFLANRMCGFVEEKWIRRKLTKYDAIVHVITYFPNGTNFLQTSACVKNGKDFELVRQVLKDLYPDYVDAFDEVMNSKTAHLFNMIITKKDNYDAYCQWIFDVLFETERRMIESGETEFSRRMGMLAERLQDVWLKKNKLKLKQCFVIHTELKTFEFYAKIEREVRCDK